MVATEFDNAKTTENCQILDREILPVTGFVYRLTRFLFRTYFFIFCGIKVYGIENIPKCRSIILAPNHTSYLDPPLIGSVIPRTVITMGKADLFRGKGLFGRLLAYTIQHMGTFPIDRDKIDRRAIKRAQTVLEENKNILVIFPEGTRSPDGKLGQAKPGFGLICYQNNRRENRIPVIPVYIEGTGDAFSKYHPGFRLVRPRVFIGERVKLSHLYSRKGEKDTYQRISDRVMEAIAKLENEARKTP